jgi:Rps23 Pro-64 3,4-dihydroxylase Tpa1-like proline 4-hydroxylase
VRVRFLAPDFDITDHGVTRYKPFRHRTFDENTLLTRQAVDSLIETFPERLMDTTKTRLRGGDKTYRVTNLTVHDRGRWLIGLDRLPQPWRPVVDYLAGGDYAASIVAALGLRPSRVAVELRLTSYPTGGWMSRHTDRPEKLFSHNIYLCPDWHADWGGALILYASATAAAPAAEFVPGAGTSIAFARSDESWHEVAPVSPRAPQPRRAILVHGYRAS